MKALWAKFDQFVNSQKEMNRSIARNLAKQMGIPIKDVADYQH